MTEVYKVKRKEARNSPCEVLMLHLVLRHAVPCLVVSDPLRKGSITQVTVGHIVPEALEKSLCDTHNVPCDLQLSIHSTPMCGWYANRKALLP